MTDLAWLDALGQADLVRTGAISAVELVEAAIARIEARNPALNAVVTPLFDSARAAGAASDAARHRRGAGRPLDGVPFLLKDLGASIGGVRQTSGSRACAGHVAPMTSELVRRHEAAGLIMLGKTNTPEFGNHSTTEPALFGPTRNPWDPTRTAGGSSGGSAAAVAAGLVPAAHGNDGAGSIRIPASCCGVVGLKPSRGRNSWAPAPDPLSGVAVEHVLTRSVRDSAALLDATAGHAPGDPWTAPPPVRPFLAEVGADPGRLRIAWSATPPLDVPVDPACRRAAQATAALLADLGHHVEEARPEFDGEVLIEPYVRIWAASNVRSWRDATSELGRQLEPDELEVTTWELVEYGRRFEAADLVDALDALALAARRIAPFFERYAAWVTPTLAQAPLPLGTLNVSCGGAAEWWRFDCAFNPWNPIANMTGRPAISLPLAWSDDGLPIGTLLTGREGDEATLLRLAGQLEAARPWADRHPPGLG
ncbi:MAG: amidase [Candidatus Limnocylindrales bacterium]